MCNIGTCVPHVVTFQLVQPNFIFVRILCIPKNSPYPRVSPFSPVSPSVSLCATLFPRPAAILFDLLRSRGGASKLFSHVSTSLATVSLHQAYRFCQPFPPLPNIFLAQQYTVPPPKLPVYPSVSKFFFCISLADGIHTH